MQTNTSSKRKPGYIVYTLVWLGLGPRVTLLGLAPPTRAYIHILQKKYFRPAILATTTPPPVTADKDIRRSDGSNKYKGVRQQYIIEN